MPAVPLSDSKSIKILVCAPSGWGKTRLAGTSPGKKNLFIRPPIDYTDSVLTEDKPRWMQWIVRDWTQMEEAFEHCRHEGEQYEWVWFDSISAYQDIGLDDLWQTIIDEKPHRKRYGMDKGDYWINMQRLGRWVRDMATLSDTGAFNFGITAWPAELSPSPEDSDIEQKMMPWVQGKNMSMKVCGYVNIVAFGAYSPKGNRVLHFMESEHIYAKDQFDMFDKYKLYRPTMPQIVAAVESKRGLEKPRTNRRRRVKKGAK
jgi:hypothetical protein